MKYLINRVDNFRCDDEDEAQAFLESLKENSEGVIVASSIARKERKVKGEVVDEWVRLTVKTIFNDEKEPITGYKEEF